MNVSDSSKSIQQVTDTPDDSPQTDASDDPGEQQGAPSNQGRLQDQAATYSSAKAFFQRKMGVNRDTGRGSEGGDPEAKASSQKAMNELGINPSDVREVADRGEHVHTDAPRPDPALRVPVHRPSDKPAHPPKPDSTASQSTLSTPKRATSGNLASPPGNPQTKQTKNTNDPPSSIIGQTKSGIETRPPSEEHMKSAGDHMKLANDYYGAGRDVLDLTKGLRQGVDKNLGKAEAAISNFKSTVAQTLENHGKALSGIEDKARGVVQDMFHGKISYGEAQQQLAKLQGQQAKVFASMKSCENMVGEVEAGVHNLRGANNLVSEASETMQRCKNFLQSGKAGKALFALDAACNFVDLQERDPSNPGKNAMQASTMSASKLLMDFKTAAPAAGKILNGLNIAETAVGVLKFGVNQLGMGDTPEGRMLNAASGAMPIDMFSKNIGMLTDMSVAVGKDIFSGGGSLKEWERINNDNLAGNNGPLAQAASFVGDAFATGGRNIPAKDSFGIADSMGIFGAAEEIPDQLKRGHTDSKLRYVKDMLESNQGNVTAAGATGNSIKTREFIAYGPPGQTVDMLKKLDKKTLMDSMVGDQKLNRKDWVGGEPTQATGLVTDLIHKAQSKYISPDMRTELMNQVGQLVNALGDNHRLATGQLHRLLNEGKLGNIPDNLRNLIRNSPDWGQKD